jgi:hypothetical protein
MVPSSIPGIVAANHVKVSSADSAGGQGDDRVGLIFDARFYHVLKTNVANAM